MPYRPVVLTILDGWGLAESRFANAPALAHTPNFDRIWRACPAATLATHGKDVGLPEGQMGNSEVGHMNIGAGRVVVMDLPRIDAAIEDGSLAQNPALDRLAEAVKDAGGRVHVMGLASDGGVHAHQRHMVELLRQLRVRDVDAVLHLFLDGRDTDRTCAMRCLSEMEEALGAPLPAGTVVGRFWAMDRDRRWDRTEAAWRLIAVADAPHRADDWRDAVDAAYKRRETDEFVGPTVLNGYGGMQDGDALLFTNFRTDRARQILSAFGAPGFSAFDTSKGPKLSAMLGMVSYSQKHNAFMDVLFPEEEIRNTLGAWVARHGLRQFRVAETEKYPHVTFFLNGGREEQADREMRYMAESPKVRTYDLQPEMSAAEVTAALTRAIAEGYDLIVVNYANPDMVGHTGSLMAAMAACEAVDASLGEVLDMLEAAGGAMIVTADHGNCEVMLDPKTRIPHTAHTLNPVPVILVGGPAGARLRDGRLADLAPTLLHLMGLEQPDEMTGRSLLLPGAA